MTVPGTSIPGTFNARDLGGLRTRDGAVRPGLMWRSDAPVELGAAGRSALRRMRVALAVDLREPVERQLDPADLAGLPIRLEEQPILDGDLDDVRDLSLSDLYVVLLETRGPALAAAIARLAGAAGAPALFFCSAGKDRTGLVSALLLDSVGVVSEDIVADYALTGENLRGPFREAIEARATAAGISEQELAVKIGAPPEAMWRVLDWLGEHHGGAAGYLRAHGVSAAELESLRRHLVDRRLALAG
jgi:protein-tyrosine phosphatase